MAICTFFQQGRCRFGERCKNEHPGQSTTGGNRFGALSGGGGGGGGGGGFGGRTAPSSQPQAQSYGLNTGDIKTDLTAGQGRPEWVFSCYGPGRNAPRQLFEGPQREQSFEELRLRHYEAAAAGTPEQAVQEAQMLYAEALQQMDTVLRDLDGAMKYVLDGANEHPNRIDTVEGKTGPAALSQPAPFGQPAQAPSLGQPSGLGQPSAFGQPSAPGQATGFGQPSALGQGSAFGQPSGLGQPSAFGQPSAPGQAAGFGQPSALGQGSAFGQPSSLGQPPSAGQSAFGQPAFGQSSFGQPSAPGTSAFGQPSTASPFSQISGQSQQAGGGFGQPAGQAATASPFAQVGAQQPGAPTGFGQPSAAIQGTTGFGQPAQTASPFGQPQQPAAPFGQPSTATATAPNPFGATAQPATASPFGQPTGGPSPFGQPAASPAQTAPAAPAPAPAAGTGLPPVVRIDESQELNPIPPMNGQTIRNPVTKRLSMWKGQPVKYIEDAPCYLHPQDRQTFVRIFFPDGPPDQASLRDAQGKPDEYTPEAMEQYEFFVKNGYFRDGVIPAVPPKTEWVSFDF